MRPRVLFPAFALLRPELVRLRCYVTALFWFKSPHLRTTTGILCWVVRWLPLGGTDFCLREWPG
jgi:hypothetical protein